MLRNALEVVTYQTRELVRGTSAMAIAKPSVMDSMGRRVH